MVLAFKVLDKQVHPYFTLNKQWLPNIKASAVEMPAPLFNPNYAIA